MMAMNGICAMLSSSATWEVKLSCGICLVFKKLNFGEYAQKEIEVVRKRGAVKDIVEGVAEALLKVKDKSVREYTLLGLKEGIKELTTRPSYAYYGEMLEFDMSPMGKATILYLCCKDNSESINSVEDAYTLLESSMSEEDLSNLEKALNWATEIEFLKKFDSPSETEVQNPNL